MELNVKNLCVEVAGKQAVSDLTLKVKRGEKVAIVGRNGSGKSSFALGIIGHPEYRVTSGGIVFQGEDISKLPMHERAGRGIFLSWQHPVALPGITVSKLIRMAELNFSHDVIKSGFVEFNRKLTEALELLGLPSSFKNRAVNQGFSGGEKKLCEFLQVMIFKPSLVILDEIEAGLDLESKKRIAALLAGSDFASTTVLVISHTPDFIRNCKPDRVYLMEKGALVETGGLELLSRVEEHGYA